MTVVVDHDVPSMEVRHQKGGSIDPQRNASKSAVMLTVKNGRSLFFESVTP